MASHKHGTSSLTPTSLVEFFHFPSLFVLIIPVPTNPFNLVSLFHFTLSLLSRICSQQYSSLTPQTALLLQQLSSLLLLTFTVVISSYSLSENLGKLVEKDCLLLSESSEKLPCLNLSFNFSSLSVKNPAKTTLCNCIFSVGSSLCLLLNFSLSIHAFCLALFKMSHLSTVHLHFLL